MKVGGKKNLDATLIYKMNTSLNRSTSDSSAGSSSTSGIDGDRVTLSANAKLRASISKIVSDSESEQEEKVQRIKLAVNSGEYNVSSLDVAKAIGDYYKK